MNFLMPDKLKWIILGSLVILFLFIPFVPVKHVNPCFVPPCPENTVIVPPIVLFDTGGYVFTTILTYVALLVGLIILYLASCLVVFCLTKDKFRV